MSEYTGWNVGIDGKLDIDLSIIDSYWEEDGHYPYFVISNSEIAGFSLLRKYPEDKTYYDIGQFFILRKFKGKGIGCEAFRQSVSKFPGKWMTRVLPGNMGAKKFWLKVISDITQGDFIITSELYNSHILMDFFKYQIINR